MSREQVKKLLNDGIVEVYSNLPNGKYITVLIERIAESECIFRTEGSGEGLNKELLYLGIENRKQENRAVISKRKQAAVERRTGREVLRKNDLLFTTAKKALCELNKNTPCGKCLDCIIYGYAVGDGGAQKSRVIYDNAYSILPFDEVADKKTFNALYENGTMRDEKGTASSSINEDEYIKPGTIFLDMITFKDLTLDEFVYSLGNILRSRRYGAMSSRIGKVKNELIKVIISDCEIFSNLELTQMTYDNLTKKNNIDFPLDFNLVKEAINDVVPKLVDEIYGVVNVIDSVEPITEYIKDVFTDTEKIKEILTNQSNQYGDK